jgi:hypothetical protein
MTALPERSMPTCVAANEHANQQPGCGGMCGSLRKGLGKCELAMTTEQAFPIDELVSVTDDTCDSNQAWALYGNYTPSIVCILSVLRAAVV